MAFDPFSAISGLVKSVIDLFPNAADKLKAQEIQAQIESQLIEANKVVADAQAKIITAEAQSDSWLARNWRPITMLTFVVLLVCHWFGWSAQNITEAQYLSLFDLIKIGLGGYVIGRSCEKVADSVGDAFGKKS